MPPRRRPRRPRQEDHRTDERHRGRRTQGQHERRPPPESLRRPRPRLQEDHEELELGLRTAAQRPTCVQDQGRLGVAVGTDAELTGTTTTELPATTGRAPIALCGDVPTWTTRICVTQLDPAENTEARRKQADALTDLAGTGRVLVGGDLADTPHSPALDPLYETYAECDQTGTSRTGANTRQNWQGTAVDKTDYLFTTPSAAVSCSVPDTRNKASDHRPLSAAVRFHV